MIIPLFGVVTGPTFSAANEHYHLIKSYVDGIELRVDTFTSIDPSEVRAFIESCALPVMITVRKKSQGGHFQGSEKERLHLIEQLCVCNPAYIDLEYDIPEDFRRHILHHHPTIQIVNSYHDFETTPHDLELLYHNLSTPYAHLTKIAVTAQNTSDALRLMDLVKSHSKKEKIIGISMGEAGQITRILSPLIGNHLTYASLNDFDLTAPGQLTAKQMQEIYHFRKLTPQTHVYALIGDPVEMSLGAIVHNAWFASQNIDAVYVKIPLKTEELPRFFQWALTFGVKGISVTMPHKESVIPFLTHPSTEVLKIGACNTINCEGTHLFGFNTDGRGAVDAIEKVKAIKGQRVVILGAGGAAKAIAYESIRRGADVTIINRTPEKASAIALLFKCHSGGLDRMPEVCKQGYEVIINCTSELEIPDEWILPETIALDIVYVPKLTPFLQASLQKNCHLIFGQKMFINQAVAQQAIWQPEAFDNEQCYNLISHILK